MKAIILAAGRGSRMMEKTDVLPKCLMKLWGKTLLEWQIKAIRKAGIQEIGIITGYHSDQIVQTDVKLFHNANWEKTNMVATLFEADEWLKSDECIVSYADIVYTDKAIKLLCDENNDISLVYYTKFMDLWKSRFDNPLDDIESFKFDQEGILVDIGQRVNCLNDVQGQYMGLLKFSPSGWAELKKYMMQIPLPKTIENIDMTGLLSYLIKKNVKIKVIPYNGLWVEVDNQVDLSLYESWQPEQYKSLQ